MRRWHAQAGTLVSVTATFLVLTAFGYGSGSEPLPSRFRSEANAVCRDGLRGVLDANRSLSRDEISDPQAAADVYLDEIQPIYRGLVDDLRDLGYPKGHKAQLRRIYAAMDRAMDRAVAKITNDPSVALFGPGTFGKVNDRLDEIGLERCGSG